MPQTGARLRTDIPVLKGYRFIQCKNYLVFYRMEGRRSLLSVFCTREETIWDCWNQTRKH